MRWQINAGHSGLLLINAFQYRPNQKGNKQRVGLIKKEETERKAGFVKENHQVGWFTESVTMETV